VHSLPPRVTVFIPTYNRARFLRHAIDSVLAQTYGDFRLEISDNASTDETPAVVASYDDPRIVSIVQPENIGMLGNHNQFLERVDTEYALILPDDDAIHPELLDRTVRVLDEHPEAGAVHTAFDVLGPENELLQEHANWTYGLTDDAVESAAEFIEESMSWSCRICASTTLMRVAALPPGGMRQEDFPAVDFGMWLRMAAAGWSFAFIGDTLGEYRIHGGSHSAAFGEPSGAGYVQDTQIVSRLKEVKDGFVDAHADRLDDPARLKRLAEVSRRRELVVMARNLTLPERRAVPTFRALADAVRSDPGVLLETSAWRLAAASLLGRRMVDRLKARRAPRTGGLAA
jgi:glycosyltransferase involved in cell wall biosynthesis